MASRNPSAATLYQITMLDNSGNGISSATIENRTFCGSGILGRLISARTYGGARSRSFRAQSRGSITRRALAPSGPPLTRFNTSAYRAGQAVNAHGPSGPTMWTLRLRTCWRISPLAGFVPSVGSFLRDKSQKIEWRRAPDVSKHNWAGGEHCLPASQRRPQGFQRPGPAL
jgi:hypothetical protein